MLSHTKNNVLMNILSYVICVFAGFLLRLCLDYDKDKYTITYITIRVLVISCVGFFSGYIYRDYHTKLGISIELYLGLVGFFGVYLINIFDKSSQLGVRMYTKILLRRLLGYLDAADTKDKTK